MEAKRKKFAVLKAIFEAGPSYSLISAYSEVRRDEVEKMVRRDPDILKAYNAKVEDVLRTIREFGAIPTLLATLYSTDRGTVDAWLTEDHRLRDAVHHFYESFTDIAELNLMMALQAREPWATLHVLRSRGAARGWAEKLTFNLDEEAKRLGLNVGQIVEEYARELVDHANDIDADYDEVVGEVGEDNV